MFAKRYPPEELIDIIAAQSYSPEIVSYVKKVEHHPTLKKYLKSKPKLGVTGTIAKDYVDAATPYAVPYISTKQVKGLHACIDDAKYISKEADIEWKKCRVEDGDIVINKSGDVGAAAVLCCAPYKYANSVSDIISLKLSETASIDRDYLVVYLNSPYGQKQLQRLSGGAIFSHVSLHAIPHINVYSAAIQAQKYIGDKVRQAERLRAWVKALEVKLDSFVKHYQPDQKHPTRLASKVSPDLLTDMLTATTYRDHYIKNQKNLRAQGRTVSIFNFLSSVTNGFDERDELAEGLPYVKVADVKPGYIDLRNSPKVRNSALEDAGSKQKPRLGDLLLTRKGSFGIAAVVMESTEFLCSSEVFSCKPMKPKFMPILAWFLNSSAGNMQFWQFSTGTTMPGINQENLGSILIPDFSGVDLVEFNCLYELRFKAKKHSEQLILAAKFLVESLIEGQLDESQLIAAEQALQSGNDQLDRHILNRLKTDGVDGHGQPLFADLDELYRLLAQAEAV